MNDEHHEPDIEQQLTDAGRDWREALRLGADAYPEFERRTAGNSLPRAGRVVASLGGVLALIAVAVLVVVSLPRPTQPIAGASPSPTSPVPSATPSPTSSATPATTARPTLTPAEAIERVVTFVGEPALTADLVASGPNDGATSRFYEVSNAHLVADVDAATGDVLSVLFLGSETPTGKGPTDDEAVQIAEAYLTEHGVPFDGMTRTVEKMDHGETWEWVVKWVREVGGVTLPDYREVGVDSTGHVWRFVSFSQPYSSPPVTAIDQTTAEAAASQAAFGDVRTQIDSTTLRLKVDPDGTQRLVWEVEVGAWEPGQPSGEPMLHAFVEVDAESGVATVIARG